MYMFTISIDSKQYIQEYKKRLLIENLPDSKIAQLYFLQREHLYHVPFENLDILLGKEIDLSNDTLYEKIVKNNRGGFCFELNQSFACLLNALNFRVQTYCARVWIDGFVTTPKKNHQVLIVKVNNQKFLVDVGFGNSFASLTPLIIENTSVQTDGYNEYRFVKDDRWGQLLEVRIGTEWTVLYSFNEKTIDYDSDFFISSFWAQRTKDLPFSTCNVLCLRTPNGRRTIFDYKYTEAVDGQNIVENLSKTTLKSILKKNFGIVL